MVGPAVNVAGSSDCTSGAADGSDEGWGGNVVGEDDQQWSSMGSGAKARGVSEQGRSGEGPDHVETLAGVTMHMLCLLQRPCSGAALAPAVQRPAVEGAGPGRAAAPALMPFDQPSLEDGILLVYDLAALQVR